MKLYMYRQINVTLNCGICGAVFVGFIFWLSRLLTQFSIIINPANLRVKFLEKLPAGACIGCS